MQACESSHGTNFKAVRPSYRAKLKGFPSFMRTTFSLTFVLPQVDCRNDASDMAKYSDTGSVTVMKPNICAEYWLLKTDPKKDGASLLSNIASATSSIR